MLYLTLFLSKEVVIMKQYNLIFNPYVLELEQKQQWETVTEYVYLQWKENPMDLNGLLCVGTESWYALLISDYYRHHPSPPEHIQLASEEKLQNYLMEATRWGRTHFSDQSMFNAYFGYMMKVMPYFFQDYHGDYIGYQEKGITMMRRAYELDPKNPLAKAMFYEPDFFGKDTPYFNACREIWENNTPEQWGNSKVQQYFFRILYGDFFYPNAYAAQEG